MGLVAQPRLSSTAYTHTVKLLSVLYTWSVLTIYPGALMSGETKKHMVSNLSTVAVVPITSDVPLSDFTTELCAAINTIGECAVGV